MIPDTPFCPFDQNINLNAEFSSKKTEKRKYDAFDSNQTVAKKLKYSVEDLKNIAAALIVTNQIVDTYSKKEKENIKDKTIKSYPTTHNTSGIKDKIVSLEIFNNMISPNVVATLRRKIEMIHKDQNPFYTMSINEAWRHLLCGLGDGYFLKDICIHQDDAKIFDLLDRGISIENSFCKDFKAIYLDWKELIN